MTQNTAVKTWTARVLSTAVVAGAMMAAVVLPASAGTSVTSWGSSPAEAAQNALAFCRKIGGKVVPGPVDIFSDNGRYKAVARCNY